VNGKFYWFMGEQAVGWVAPEDVAAVASKSLRRAPNDIGPSNTGFPLISKTGTEAAAEIRKDLAFPVEAIVLTPDDLAKQVSNGAMKLPPFV